MCIFPIALVQVNIGYTNVNQLLDKFVCEGNIDMVNTLSKRLNELALISARLKLLIENNQGRSEVEIEVTDDYNQLRLYLQGLMDSIESDVITLIDNYINDFIIPLIEAEIELLGQSDEW